MEMSSGEAKRILIARALVHDPQTLVFDEPSNSLDVFAHARVCGKRCANWLNPESESSW